MKGNFLKLYYFVVKVYFLTKIYNFFNSRQKSEYCFIKKNKNFPNVSIYSDFDIYISNRLNIYEELIEYFEKNKKINLKIFQINKNKIHLDLLNKQKFIYKLDLDYENIESAYLNTNNTLHQDTISSSEKFSFKFGFRRYNLFFPNELYDLTVRLIEFNQYPHKTHHQEMLNQTNDELREMVLNLVKKYSDRKLNF